MIKKTLLYAAILVLGAAIAAAWADSEPYSPQSAPPYSPQPSAQAQQQGASVAAAPYPVYTAVEGQTYSICPPGQVAAYPTSQLWASQYDVHTAWDCFVPRNPAFEPRYSAVPDPALHGVLPSMTGRSAGSSASTSTSRGSSSSSSSATAASSASGASNSVGQGSQGQAEVNVDVNVDVNVSVTANGQTRQSGAQVTVPTVSATVTTPLGQTSSQTGPQTTSAATSTQTAPQTESVSQTGQVSPAIPNSLPTPIVSGNGEAALETVSPVLPSNGTTTPGTSGASAPSQDTQTLLNAQPVLPSAAGNGGSRGIN